MSVWSALFGRPRPAHPAGKPVVVRMDGVTIVDLREVPTEIERVFTVLEKVAATITEGIPNRLQVWVASGPLLAAFSGNTDALMKLTDLLYQCSKQAEPKLIIEGEAPRDVVYILGSLGFKAYKPGLRLTTVDASGRAGELDVIEHLEKLRSAPRLSL